MNFDTSLDQAWNDHATKPESVATALQDLLPLVGSSDQLVQLTGLATHVFGEHLGQWSRGLAFLRALHSHPHFKVGHDVESAVRRSTAVLELAANRTLDLSNFTVSDQIRILAVATSAIGALDVAGATKLFEQALKLASDSLTEKDPANRALAITGNNLACTLEEKSDRSPEERNLMILAAQTARKYWQRAGGWLEVAIAEYRLAMTYIQAGEAGPAIQHAQNNIEICRANSAGDRNLFYGYEALALAEEKRANRVGFEAAVASAKAHFANLGESDKSELAAALARLG